MDQSAKAHPVSGHVFRNDRKRVLQWYAKYRVPNGRQVQKHLGPHLSDRSTELPPGYFTKRTAEGWLDETLAKARRGELGGIANRRETVTEAVDEWLRVVGLDRQNRSL
jgi:integrase